MKWVACFLFLFMISLVGSTVISIDNGFSSKYNVGDFVEVNFEVSSEERESDFLYTYLDCGSEEEIADKRYVFMGGNKSEFSFELPLFEKGYCSFRVEFDSEVARSEEFEVSDEIEVNYELNDKFFFPGEELKISGNLSKFNGDVFSGKVDFEVKDLVEKSLEVSDGVFEFSYSFGEDALAQKYLVVVYAYEEDEGEIINSGRISEKVEVKAVPSFIEVGAPESLKPPKNQSLEIVLFDQSRNVYPNESVVVEILDKDYEKVFQKEIESPGNFYFSFPSNFPRGSAFVNAYYGDLHTRKPIYIEDSKHLDVFIEEGNLKFYNSGNVFYKGSYRFLLENGTYSEEIFVNLSLGVGEEYVYVLDYEGIYNLSSDEENFTNQELGKSVLTGYAILQDSPITIWTILVTIFLIGLIVVFAIAKTRTAFVNFLLDVLEKIGGLVGRLKKRRLGKEVPEDIPEKFPEKREAISVAEMPKIVDDGRRKVFILYLKSEKGIKNYEGVVKNEDFVLRKMDLKEGYVLIFKNERDLYSDFYVLAEKILEKSDEIKDNVQIVLNTGNFHKKIEFLKRFVLFNKGVAENTHGRLIIFQSFMKNLEVKGQFTKKVYEFKEHPLSIFVKGE